MPHTYRNIVRAFYGNQWAILPEKMEEIREFLTARANGVTWTPEEIQARIGERPTPFAAPQGSQVAVLNLFGVMSQRMNSLEQTSGGTSTEQFGAAFDEAVANDDVKAIVLNVDSPGGAVMGTPELGAKIFAARGVKPIVSVVNSLAASAGLWVAAQADEIVMTQSGQIGSLGVLAIHRDESGAMEQAGVKETVISASPFKAEQIGPLTKSATTHIQEMVDRRFVEFVAAVAAGRGVSPETAAADFGQGRMLDAETAMNVGLADRIGTLQEVLAEFGVSSTPSVDATTAPAFQMKGFSNMDTKIFGALVRIGMCDITATEADAEKALGRFFAVRSITPPDTDEAKLAALQTFMDELTAAGNTPGGILTPAGIVPVLQAPAASVTQVPAAAVTTGMSSTDIIAAISISSLPDADKLDLQSSLLAKPHDMAAVKAAIQEKAAANALAQGADTITFGEASIDKFRAHARDAILCRMYPGANRPTMIETRQDEVTEFKPTLAASRAHGITSLPKLAATCFIECGYDARQIMGMSNVQIAQALFKHNPGEALGLRAASDGPAFNVSGLFNNILLDAANVTLRRSYTEVPVTYTQWMRQGPSVADFKTVNKIIAGELTDVKAIPEDGEFEEVTLGDAKETYKLVVWGSVWSQTWQSVVNDQLGAFTEIPAKFATSMRRKQNKLAYAILKDNDALADTGALFNATATSSAGGHANLETGAGAPSVAELNILYKKMAIQAGITSGTTLGITPQFIIFPMALRGTVLQLLGSTANPAAGGNAAGSSGVVNIWQNALTPVEDAQLDAGLGGSDTAWYLAATTSQVDTIEYAFLIGLETPAFDQEVAFDRLAIRQRIYQAFVVKAIDYRGLQKHAGA